jgi:Family of unknown function (DUF5681)
VADNEDYTVGFQKPPKHTRFVKGKSGNPLGRPKGSHNATTVFDEACSERIRVTINGEVRYLSKYRAAMKQLMNKAAAGDLRATQLLLGWLTWRIHSQQVSVPAISLQEKDKFVMESIAVRFRNSEPVPPATEPAVPPPEGGSPEDQG